MKFFTREKPDDTDYSKLSLREIVSVVKKDWKGLSEKKNNYANELLEDIETLKTIGDNYYEDSGVRIVVGFLDEAKSWTTYTAQKVKKELARRINEQNKKLQSKNI
jgi:hypothetical protein